MQSHCPDSLVVGGDVMSLMNIMQWLILRVFSLGNFSVDEIGDPVMDIVVEAGDLLYFPRGFIHQVLCYISTSYMNELYYCNG